MFDRIIVCQVGPLRFCQLGLRLFQTPGSLRMRCLAFFCVFVFLGSVIFGRMNLFRCMLGKLFYFAFLFGCRFVVFFLNVKVRTANQRVGISARLRLFMLCFDEPRRQRAKILIAQCRRTMLVQHSGRLFFVRVDRCTRRMFRGFRCVSLQRGALTFRWFAFGFRIRQNPMRQAPREPARYPGIRRQAHCGP